MFFNLTSKSWTITKRNTATVNDLIANVTIFLNKISEQLKIFSVVKNIFASFFAQFRKNRKKY